MKIKTLLFTAVAILGIAAFTQAQVPNYVPTNGLVGWWPLDGDCNDYSGNLLNGSIVNSYYTNDRFQNPQHALQIVNNANALSLPQQISLPNKFSLACWIKVPIDNSLNSNLPSRDIPGVGINDWGIGVWNGSLISQIDWPGSNEPYLYSSNSHLNDSIWHHIVFIADRDVSGLHAMYIDGLLDTSRIVPLGTFVNSNIPITINNGNIKIDDIGIWNRMLTQQEITALHNSSSCVYYDTVTTHVTVYDTTHVIINDTVTTYLSVSDTLKISVNLTGINPPNNNNLVKVYPNPTKDHILIDCGSYASMNGYNVKITNSLGQVVFNQPVTQQQFYVDLSTWGGAGTYIMYITDPNQTVKSKKQIVLQ